MDYFYLHGFASSPQSHKAQYLRDRFAERGQPLNLLDLNQDNFAQLTLTRQLQQVTAALTPDRATTVIGSSLGGLTAAFFAARSPQIKRLVLLAPAFGFPERWVQQLGEETLTHWQHTGHLPVYHYGWQREMLLDYNFWLDAQQYDWRSLPTPPPTLILHGRDDEVVPLTAVRDYAQTRSRVTLIELESDHTLKSVLPEVWQHTQAFLRL